MPTRLKAAVRWSRTLPARIVFLMTIAMLPVGLIAIYQTQVVIESARTLNRAALMSQIDSEAARERELIEHALAASQGLAVLIEKLGEENCADILRGFVDGNGGYIFAAFVRASGFMPCSSSGDVLDLSERPSFQTAMARGGSSVQFNPEGAVTGRSVVLVTRPVYDGDKVIGVVSLSIPHSLVIRRLEDLSPDKGLLLAVIDPDGEVISATTGIDGAARFLPADVSPNDLPGRTGETFRAMTRSGEERFFAVTPMVPGTVLLVGSWPLSAVPEADGALQVWLATALPVLMWIAGVGVALVGMERMVVRHVAELRSAMRRFALGDRSSAALELPNAPAELEEAQRAFNRMALLISDGEARREQDLKDKEVLLREVHHRVKNNLQLIVSMMNMQSRSLETEEAKHVVAELQRRVRSMAVLHRALYNTPNAATVDAAELVSAVVRDISDQCGAVPGTRIETALTQVDLYPDQAVPLSLLVAETLNRAFRHAPESDGRIAVELVPDGEGLVRLLVQTDATRAEDPADDSRFDRMVQTMIAAFLRQLDGKMETTSEDGRYRVIVRFPRVVYGA